MRRARPSRLRYALWALVLWVTATNACLADELLMRRVTRAFPETMTALQQAIKEAGYTVSRVQRVDVGLTASGYETAEYRVVFFGKREEMHDLSRTHPELIPYLPLGIVIFAEGEDTLLLMASPQGLGAFFKDPRLISQFARWQQDVDAIFDRVANTAR